MTDIKPVASLADTIPELIIVMGVSGAGKSTIAEALTAALKKSLPATYLDGDDFHPAENIAKMARGEPLTDDDRWPWLGCVSQAMVEQLQAQKTSARDSKAAVVAACSALKLSYRQQLTRAAGQPILFVYLVGDEKVIAERMSKRTGHFMPPSLLQSQLATVEPPSSNENAVAVSIENTTAEIVADIVEKISQRTDISKA